MTNMKHSHLIIMGDFNYRNINWKSWSTISDNTQSNDNKFIECLRDDFLFQHVNNPTRGRGSDTPHLLDLVITNIERMVTDIEHMSPLGKSDHSILSLKLNCYSKINTYSKTKIYYDKADYDTIQNELNDAEWINNIHNNQEDINKQWELFTTKINQLIQNYVPHKIITNNRKRKFPIDKETQKIIHNKHKLWKQLYYIYYRKAVFLYQYLLHVLSALNSSQTGCTNLTGSPDQSDACDSSLDNASVMTLRSPIYKK